MSDHDEDEESIELQEKRPMLTPTGTLDSSTPAASRSSEAAASATGETEPIEPTKQTASRSASTSKRARFVHEKDQCRKKLPDRNQGQAAVDLPEVQRSNSQRRMLAGNSAASQRSADENADDYIYSDDEKDSSDDDSDTDADSWRKQLFNAIRQRKREAVESLTGQLANSGSESQIAEQLWNACAKNGNSVFHVAAKTTCKKDLVLITHLLQLVSEQGEMLLKPNKRRKTPLQYACQYQEADTALLLVDKLPQNDRDCLEEIVDSHGDTVFHYAARNRNDKSALIKLLDKSKSKMKSLKTKNKKGKTPLWCACECQDISTVAELAEIVKNSLEKIVNSDWKTVFHYAAKNNCDLPFSAFAPVEFKDKVYAIEK